MRLLCLLTAGLLLAACAPSPAPAPAHKPDPATEPWYAETVAQLTALNREAAAEFTGGRRDAAAALVTKGQPLQARLLGVPHPTLAAVEAASDLDHLYGRLLLANGHTGWARLVFQKNLVRWKNWQPPSESARTRLAQARADIAACDRQLAATPN